MLDARGLVLWGCEGRPGSPVNDKGDILQLTDESVAAILRQLSDLDMLAISRYLYPESYAVGEVSILWADLDTDPRGRGTDTQSSGEVAPVAVCPLQVGGPKAGWAWGNPKRGIKSTLNVAVDHQWPPVEGSAGLLSDPESFDEFSEIELMRVRAFIPKKEARPSSTAPRIPGTHSDT